ncbi:MAG: mandelate racemase/muconate lactonizing enzyme family protein [bacterium]
MNDGERLPLDEAKPLRITSVEAFVVRSPNDEGPPESYIEMPPLGTMTGGLGLVDRLDHASPTRFRGYQQAVLVRVGTDQGIVGWGECHAPGAPRVHQTIVTDLLAPVIMGEDARNVEALWERMYSTQRLRGYATGFYTEAIAGVDIALWDALGKYAGLPLYRLLGGKYRDSIPTYTGVGGRSIEQLVANAVAHVESGFSMMKMGLSKGAGTRDLERVAAVSDAIKGRAQVMVDSLGGYKLHEALAVGRELDSLGNIGWWEDALMPEDMDGFAALTARLDVPICLGEELSNRFQFRDMAARRAMDIVNPDVCRAGGITECRRIAMIADLHGILWSPHVSTGTPVYMSASLHLAVATPNASVMEGGGAHLKPLGNALLREPLDYRPGTATVSERPGLGIDFDESALSEVIVSA